MILPALLAEIEGPDARAGNVDRINWPLRLVQVQIFSLIFLQKFALHAGDSDIQLLLPILLIGIAAMSAFDRVEIDITRFLLFAAFAIAAIVSQLISGNGFSAPSLLLILLMYSVICLHRNVEADTYLEAIDFYQKCMIAICFITIVQQITQYSIGAQYWPSLDNMVPAEIILRGYNYLQPLSWGSPYFKPNAFFLVEVSEIQQLCAIALLIEIAYFRRIWVLGVLAVTILITFAGTGLLILLFAAPFVLFSLPARVSLATVAAGAIGLALAIYVGWLDQISGRFAEFTTPDTSGYFRFTLPVLSFIDNLGDPAFLFSGVGAGGTPKGTAFILLPFAKLMFEYGFLSTFLFYLFLCVCLFHRAPSALLAYVGFLQYNLGGGTLAIPMSVTVFFALFTFLRVDRMHLHEALVRRRRPNDAAEAG